MMAVATPPLAPALQKLVNVFGQQRADAIIAEVKAKAGIVTLESPDDRYRFAIELMERGGVLEAIGRAIKIQAILHGAKGRLATPSLLPCLATWANQTC